MLTDTHAHLDYPDFADDLEKVIANADAAGVKRIITIGTSIESSKRAVELSERFPQVWAAVGIHPTNSPEDFDPESLREDLRSLAMHPRVVAIGETGLDYHRLPGDAKRDPTSTVSEALGADDPSHLHEDIVDDAYITRQAELFQLQLELAADLGMNVIVHQRDAWDDTLKILRGYDDRVRGVFHCFTNTFEQALDLIDLGHLVSFTGIVTFKNAEDVRETVRKIPDDTFMVETDCPYLAPEPHRGKRCEPAHTRLVAERIAAVRDSSLEALAARTEAAAERFFHFQRRSM